MVSFQFKLFCAIIFAVIISLSMMNTVPAAGSSEPLSAAMEATGAKVEEFSINAWVKLPNGNLNDAQLADLVEQVMGQLEIAPQDYQLLYHHKNKNKIVQAEVINKKFHAMVMAQVIPREVTEFEGYLVVNMEARTEDVTSIRGMQEKIVSITNKFSSSTHISTCLIGWLGGKLMDGECHKLLSDAFMVIDGKIIDKLEADHFVSYTGFTSEITDWLAVDGKRINLNMAMRYSQYDNRTYVTMGSPIITREY